MAKILDPRQMVFHIGSKFHKGLPVFDAGVTAEFRGVMRGWEERVEYNFPTSMDPDAEHKRTLHAGVLLFFVAGNHHYHIVVPKADAKELYDSLGEALGLA